MWPVKCVNTKTVSRAVTNKIPHKTLKWSIEKDFEVIVDSPNESHLDHCATETNASAEQLKSCISQKVTSILCKPENGDEQKTILNQRQTKENKNVGDLSLTAFVQKCADPIDGEIYIKKASKESNDSPPEKTLNKVRNASSNDTIMSGNSIPSEANKNASFNNVHSTSDVSPITNICEISHNDLYQLSTNVLPSYVPSSHPSFQQNENTEAFNCADCGDHFLLENSLSRHLERRSILVKFLCESCNKVLAYYNRCALLAHIRSHQEKGEPSDIQKATVLPLPRELMDGFLSSSNFPIAELTDTIDATSNSPNADLQDPQEKYRCPECGLRFTSVRNHFGGYQNLPLQASVCTKCNMACPTKCSLQAHQRIHLQGRPYVCPECGERFLGTWERFQQHLKHKCYHFSRLIGYKCSVCGILYSSTDVLQTHIIDSHSEAYFKCQACPMAFKATSTFESHRKSTHPTLDIQFTTITKCPLCDTVFHSKELLQTHLKGHIKDQLHNTKFVFKCSECNGLLESKPSMLLHIQKSHHHLLSQKICSQCGLAFPTSKALKEHSKDIHHGRNGQSTTKCCLCHREFQTIHGYRIHRQRCHGMACRRCATCGETLANKSDLLKHGAQHLKEGIHVCLVCNNEKFSSSDSLLLHLQQHAKTAKYPNQCLQCEQTLSDAKEAFCHLKEEHKLTVFRCKQCDSAYESSIRLARHHKVMHEEFGLKKRHVCWICKEYGFSKRAILKRHITTKHSIPEDEIDFSQAPRPPIKIRIPLVAVKRHYSSDDKSTSWERILPKKRTERREYNPSEYICAKCDFRSSDSCTFKEHIVIHKTEQASYQCTECGACFVVEPSLKRHLLIAHKIHDANKYLSKTETSVDSNTLECKVCFCSFKSNDLLQIHLRSHGMAFIQSRKSSKIATNNHSIS